MGLEFCTGGCDNGDAYWWLFWGIPFRYIYRVFLTPPSFLSKTDFFFFEKASDERTNKIKQFNFGTFVMAMFVVQMGAARSFTRSPQGCYDLCLLLWRTIPLLFLQGLVSS